uniref:Peptidase S1 domain-containing protein n=2 Tax=Colobus angolensis palliatus TaxID=336983 RepID=A0A2K5IPM0_COLAP
MLLFPVALAFNPDYTVSSTPPYLVYLKSDYLPCAGVLIHPLWVITAAHCNLPKLRVILGVTIPADSSENHLQVIGYEKMIHHPRFSITSIDHDIMLIKLKTEAELNDYVKLANLPYQTISENTMCSVSTWSYNVCDIYKEPDSLQTVNISVISKPQCRDAYQTHNIKENMLCVGIVPGRRQPCKEVSAAPAICNGILQGILSFADGCVLRADVGIYAKIFYYIPWIENVIQNN